MANFYDNWLGMWDKAEEERAASRRNIHEEELQWVETAQDFRAALMISPETGFRTWGTTTMTAEIPSGGHTGAHKHGEEAILIVEGTGYSVIDNIRYDWKRHSVVAVPFGAVHQHFNTGDDTVRYVSILSVHLEHYAGLHRTIQVEPFGMTSTEPDVERSPDGLAPEGNRIVLHREDGTRQGGETDGVPVPEIPAEMPEFDPEHPLILGDLDGMGRLPVGMHHGGSSGVGFMSCRREVNGFRVYENEISGILSDEPHAYGGMHAHMEAHLYCLAGHGYTTVGDEKVEWRKGSAWWVPGPQTPHRHVNESDEHSEMVRIAFGIRYFFERSAKREFPYLYLSPRQAVLERSSAGRS
ncbi:MAG TPA: cupin domain-containing protein [Acidimicrobiales bacterium]|nr:cupin domain-containing protein [Acidimicrobiales bacterium]